MCGVVWCGVCVCACVCLSVHAGVVGRRTESYVLYRCTDLIYKEIPTACIQKGKAGSKCTIRFDKLERALCAFTAVGKRCPLKTVAH